MSLLEIEPAVASSMTGTELELRQLLAQFLASDVQDIPADRTFLEMGVDSLGLLSAAQLIWEKMGVRIPFRMMLDEYPTLSAVAAFIDQNRPAAPDPPRETEPASESAIAEDFTPAGPPDVAQTLTEPIEVKGGNSSSLDGILARQLDIMRIQLQLLSSRSARQESLAGRKPASAPSLDMPAAPVSALPAIGEKKPSQLREPTESFVAYHKLNPATAELNRRQEEHLSQLINRYTTRTVSSKRLTERYRKVLADNRVSAGFRLKWKEMIYQILVDRAEGCRFWDVDGNEYIDITMGFGAIIFGHSPSFLMDALRRQVDAGIGIGPQSRMAGEVAELLCKLTGCERAAFCNSGTEAVMSALRLARTITGRERIAIFTGSYHGTFDGVMVRGEEGPDGDLRAIPLAPGVQRAVVNDALLLRYNHARSLEILRARASELAAVIVAPIPSRDPEGHNQNFLHCLREITEQSGAALIFDEVVTGFRVHPGGAQALFGIRADLVTYGKAVGGGLPIGVIAGKARFMDAIDGGSWSFGNKSYPKAETTFFAGTFFKHPWVMASALAVLKEIEKRGIELYDSLARVTSRFADEVNAFFRENDLPFEISAYASFFMIQVKGAVINPDLFYYYLLEKGIYVWEGRSCFFSTAHTPEDVEQVARAVRESAMQMREAGFTPAPHKGKDVGPQTEVAESGPVPPSSIFTRRMPMSEEQRGLWAVTQIGPESSRAYNESLCLHLKGKLSIECLQQAIRQLANRHEALRTTFDAGGQFQTIHAHMSLDLPLDDLSSIPLSDRQGEVSRWIENQLVAPFDLEHGPLVRARLARLSDEHHVFGLIIHHLVVDGWSLGILLKELGTIYSALAEGKPCLLSEPGRLTDSVNGASGAGNTSARLQDEEYWTSLFAEEVPVLQLPTDRPRPRLQTFRGGRIVLKLPPELREAAATAALKSGSTLFVELLSGYTVLLHRLTGQQDTLIGVPIAGQLTSGKKELVAYNVKMVPIKSTLDPELLFSQHVKQIGTRLMDALDHSDVPLSRIARILKIRRDPDRPPLISGCFNLDKRATYQPWFGLECERAETEYSPAKFDLDLDAVECLDGSVDLECTYNADLFDAATARRWMEDYRALLEDVASNPFVAIKDLELQSVRNGRHAAEVPTSEEAGPECLHDVFELQALKTPSAPAIVSSAENLSYRELQMRVEQMARYLLARGASMDKTVAVCLERGVGQIVAVLGILKSGAAYLPLDPAAPILRTQAMLKHASPSILITSSKYSALFNDFAGCVVNLQVDAAAIASAEKPSEIPKPDRANLAYVIHTSGSTGTPKGVAIEHRSAVNFVSAAIKTYGLTASDRVLRFASLSFDASVEEIFCTLGCGAALVIANDSSAPGAAELFTACAEFGITVLDLPSGYWHSLVESFKDERPLLPASLRLVILGGETLRMQAVGGWRHFCSEDITLINSYGPAETTVIATAHTIAKVPDSADTVPIGRAIGGVQIFVVDQGLQLRPVGATGEICIAGCGVARGYLHQAVPTAAAFVPDPFTGVPGARMYRSGDMGRVRNDGVLDFCGRNDEQIKLRGYRVDPGEIESALLQHPGVREAAVKGFDKSTGPSRLVAYVVLGVRGGATSSDLRNHLQARLPEYMIPSVFRELESLPRMASGKVDRNALLPDFASAEGSSSLRGPSNETEQHLVRIWQGVLGVEKISVDDNFFELGGDSILAIQIASRAAAVGIKLTTQLLFEHQTIAALAETVEPAPEPEPAATAPTPDWPLTPIQSWFFELNLPDRNHWNQAVLLETRETLETTALAKALQVTIQNHAALTLRFIRTPSGMRMSQATNSDSGIFSTIDLSSLEPESRSRALVEHATRIQESLDIENGSLCRFVHFKMGDNVPGRFLAVIHHLVVDVVSWRILLGDLAVTYRQAQSGQQLVLPPPTTSYGEWARHLSDYARGTERASELDFWLHERRANVLPLPVDHLSPANYRSSQRTVDRFMNPVQTAALVRGAPRHLKSPISEVLLAALAIALSRWTLNPRSLVDVEGHGREELFPDVNLTRTVGWFTSIYPVLLDGEPEEFKAVLQGVKGELRSIPHAGIGYGILRYLHPDPAIRERFRHLPTADICFNYLGQLDQVLDLSGPFLPAAESSGESQPADSPQSHLLALDVSVVGGRLRHLWTYNKEVHEPETIERLASFFGDALESAVEASIAPQEAAVLHAAG